MNVVLSHNRQKHSTLEIDLVSEDDGFAALAPQWWELWRRVPNAGPFQTPAWLLAWWKTFKPGGLRCATVRQNRELVAIAPFYVEQGPRGSRLLPVGIAVSDYLDVLVDPVCEPLVGRVLLDCLIEQGGAERLCCEELPPGATALQLWQNRMEKTRQSASPVLSPLDIPKAKARKVRMARNRMERRSGRIVSADCSNCSVLLDGLIRLHGERWAARGERGLLSGSLVPSFLASALPDLFTAAIARLHAVQFGETIAGVYLGFLVNARGYAYLGGFDPAFSYESPGTVLLAHAIEEARHSGAREFHFLRGREAYKYAWGAADRWNTHLELLR
jgi:CelD/BcsL family acetyltransferase involved in cellulose biosynthesis